MAMRPLESGQLMDLSLALYRAIGVELLKLSFVPALLCHLVIVFMLQFLLPNLGTTRSVDPSQQAFEVVTALVMIALVGLPALFISLAYSAGATCHAAFSYLLGRKLDLWEAETAAREGLWNLGLGYLRAFLPIVALLCVSALLLFWSSTLPSEGLWAGFVAIIAIVAITGGILIVPFESTRYALLPCVCVLERLRGKGAVNRARALLQKSEFHPAGYATFLHAWAFVVLTAMILSVTGEIIFSLLGDQELTKGLITDPTIATALGEAVSQIPMFVALWLILPVWGATCAIVYLDRRIRLEGFDIEVLSNDAQDAGRKVRFEF